MKSHFEKDKLINKFELVGINIQNFKCFDFTSLLFYPNVNLFIGTNSSGKTAILEAISVACGCFFGTREPKMNRYIYFGEIQLKLTPKEKQSEIGTVYTRSEFSEVSGWFATPNHLSKIEVDGELVEINATKVSRRINARTSKNDNTGSKALAEYGRIFFKDFEEQKYSKIAPLISYLSTQRLFKVSYLSKDQKYDPAAGRIQGYLNCLKEESAQNMLLDWLYKEELNRYIQQRNSEKLTINRPLDNVFTAIKAVITSFTESDATEVHIWPDATEEGRWLLQVNDHILPFANYSDGFRNVVLLIMDLVWRASILNPWLDFENLKAQTHGVVMIDEVDLHLHPRWQGKVIPFLAELFPNVQFFITTHSPTVISTFSPKYGALFAMEDNDIKRVDEKYYGRTIGDIITKIQGGKLRTPEILIQIDDVFKSIEDEPNAPETHEKLKKLEITLGSDDPAVIRATNLLDINSD